MSVPSAPITRWHGTTMARGFLPLAAPTAREILEAYFYGTGTDVRVGSVGGGGDGAP